MRTHYAQLFLRLALGIGFILPVLDRFGFLGLPGEPNVGWGNWPNFIDYTHSLMPYVSLPVAGFMGAAATAAEILFGMFLIAGFKTKVTALGSFILTLTFALSMLFFAGYRAPFNYSVFVCSAGSLLLSTLGGYKWSVDEYLSKK